MKTKENQFWFENKGKTKISHAKLIKFLENEGFAKIKVTDETYIYVRIKNNRIRKTTIEEMTDTVKDFLVNIVKNDEVYETFVTGISGYLNNRKLNLLNKVELVDDRDGRDNARFFFKNCFCEIAAEGIKAKGYDQLEFPIWENRVLDYDYQEPKNENTGQFETFCWHLAKKDQERFISLKSFIGYLTHRNKDRGESKAVILYDENMGLNDEAHGGTGKTLLSDAINQCKEVEKFDGKNIKTGSWFKNQRIDLTTDLLVYDDLNKTVSLEEFYAMITSGIEIEKKHKDSFFIEENKSPKIMITSNYVVKGPGGSSDERRRYEFEVANYYDNNFTPEDEFGNRFFDKYWAEEERNKFYRFMMRCVQLYLQKGLVKADEINLRESRLKSKTHPEFYEFANDFVETNTWQDKRYFESLFTENYSCEVSPHKMAKWLVDYAADINGKFEKKSTGGNYLFRIKKEGDGARK